MFKWSALLVWGFCVATLTAKDQPRLAVVISVDQMRADYLQRFGPYFGEGGFKRLLGEGADYRNCFYRHGVTKTAPGHATILSGVNANVHGIIANEWLDPVTLELGNAVEDAAAPLVGLPPREGRSPGNILEKKAGRSPHNFLGVTVGDRLKARYPQAKVFGVADKDRAAILMAGAKADAAYWTEDGRFVTSTYYRTTLPRWLEKFNEERNATHYFGQVWDRLLDPAVYDRVQGPDDGPGESQVVTVPTTFPKKIDGGKASLSGTFFDAFDFTPWNNDMVGAMARRLVEEEDLGRDEIPDLLCIGFSETDKVGHAFGPDSHEVMDAYLRLDRTLAELFAFLDGRVGLAHCVIVLTADHGVCPLPEHTQLKEGANAAGRMSSRELNQVANQALDVAFGPAPDGQYWTVRDGSVFRFNPATLKATGVAAEKAAPVLRAALLKVPGIAEAWTREQLTGAAELDAMGERMRLSFYPPRTGDVMFLVKPFWLVSVAGTDHGSPYDYDSHVPLVWFGTGIAPGVHPERVNTEDLAPTLAGLLGVKLPREAKGKRLFK